MAHVAAKTSTTQTPWVRTLWQGLAVDALVLIGLGLATLMDSGVDPATPIFWAGVGGLVIKSLLTATASYLVRLKVAPPA